MSKTKPKQTAGEYDAFSAALRKVLSVTHSEMKGKLDAEKRARKRRASRASGAKD